jgi:hypothetical protein
VLVEADQRLVEKKEARPPDEHPAIRPLALAARHLRQRAAGKRGAIDQVERLVDGVPVGGGEDRQPQRSPLTAEAM